MARSRPGRALETSRPVQAHASRSVGSGIDRRAGTEMEPRRTPDSHESVSRHRAADQACRTVNRGKSTTVTSAAFVDFHCRITAPHRVLWVSRTSQLAPRSTRQRGLRAPFDSALPRPLPATPAGASTRRQGSRTRAGAREVSATPRVELGAYVVPMDASEYLAVAKRRWPAVLMCLVAGIAAALSLVRSTPETYRATTKLIINIPAAREVYEALAGVELSSQLLASYAQVATSHSAAEAIVEELDLDESPGSIQGRISAEPVPETLLMRISAVDTDPRRAKRLADGAAEVFVEQIRDLEQATSGTIVPRVIDAAQVPSAPISPRPKRDLAIGAFFGLAVGAGIAVMLEALDRSVRNPGEAVRLGGAPILAMVPKRRDSDSHPVLAQQDAGTPAAESYRVLRTAVRFVDLDRDAKSLVVTSPSAGDGKTSTAANLGVALAQAGERVLLVDADLRRTKLAGLFDVRSEPGLTSVLIGNSALDDSLVQLGDRLALLPTGPLPPNPSELLGSEAMASLVRELQNRFDILIFDAPPLLPVTDAQVLATQVDGVVLVMRFGKTKRDLLSQARARLDIVGARLFGLVLNAVPASADYSEEYSYTAYQPRRKGGRRWALGRGTRDAA